MDEFREACTIISAHAQQPLSPEQINEMGKSIDRNGDGNIDINEFLEAFRIVDRFGRELKRKSVDSGRSISINGEAGIIEEHVQIEEKKTLSPDITKDVEKQTKLDESNC